VCEGAGPCPEKGILKLFQNLLVLLNSLWKSVRMSSYNRLTLMGNLTRDPELRKTKKGASVTELGLALNRKWNDEGGQRREETTFVDVIVWGKTAENCTQYLKKGRSVLLEGRLFMDSWKDKDTGETRNKLRVVADSVLFLGSNQDSGGGGEFQEAA